MRRSHRKERVFRIPGLFTFLNWMFGFSAIWAAVGDDYYLTAWFIILAVLCDGMDGKVARFTHSESRMGLQLDSLADAVSFGVAPALLWVRWAFRDSPFGFLIGLVYLSAGLYRLARFHVLQGGNREKGYIGLPIPIPAMTLAAFFLFVERIGHPRMEIGTALLPLFYAVLMVSGVHYAWPSLTFETRLKGFFSIGVLLLVSGMALFPAWVLFPALNLYILIGVGRAIGACLKGEISFRLLVQPMKTRS